MTLAVDAPYARQKIIKPGLQWGAALKALRRLLRDKEDTVQVFEIMRALNGRCQRPCLRALNARLSTISFCSCPAWPRVHSQLTS